MPDVIHLTLGWIHLLAVIFWIGGAIFFDMILQPSLKSISPDQLGKLNQAVVKRFMPLVWGAIIIIAATGLLQANYIGVLSSNVLFGTGYGNVLLVKMVIFLVMLMIGLVITRVGIRLSRGATPEYAMRAQKQIKILSEANIVLGIIVVLLAVTLRIGV